MARADTATTEETIATAAVQDAAQIEAARISESLRAQRRRYEGDITELKPILDAVESPSDYYDRIFHWMTPLIQKRYLMQHVAPLANGKYLVYPYDNPQSKIALVLDKDSLYEHIATTDLIDSESNTPFLTIVGWSLFMLMIFHYIVPVEIAGYFALGFFSLWVFIKLLNKHTERIKLRRKYADFEKFHGDRHKFLREKIGNMMYINDNFFSYIIDLLLIIASTACLIYVIYYFQRTDNLFFSVAAIIGLLFLAYCTARTWYMLVTLNRFRRNTGRTPSHRDMVHLTPDAPVAPYFH